jgi:hypothetical protein
MFKGLAVELCYILERRFQLLILLSTAPIWLVLSAVCRSMDGVSKRPGEGHAERIIWCFFDLFISAFLPPNLIVKPSSHASSEALF